ncbi:MAG: 4-hydroxy-tetrahydrodipicolinate reductase [Methanomicrobiales archaeon]|nr:4-hydroxy-tetrahydrodipicolinate reductase [Methanomicrobiales archaeon]MDD1671194.1 4-hydroxy-tetrahydrodipicolinate reductase [Methanomicrobiales archaeon]
MIKVVVCGALGRMGGTVARLVHEASDLELAGGVDVRAGTVFGAEVVPSNQIDAFLEKKKPDVLVDFTVAAAAVENVKAAARHRVAAVVGTTGFSPNQREEMKRAVEATVPAVITSNFSVGVNIFWFLVREAAKKLGDYDIEVIEAHHRNKKDAPSGTAKTILEILDAEVGTRPKLYGREGMTERGKEIGVHVIRGGDIVGEHTVLFCGNFECIELSHRAQDRSVFAMGALRAIRWVGGRKPGVYSMADVLNLHPK